MKCPFPRRKSCRFVLSFCLSLAVGLLMTASALSAALLPVEIRTSDSPPATLIQGHLANAVKLLSSAAAAEQTKGREMIVEEVGPAGAKQPSPAFLLVYARELNTVILPLAKNESMRVRLNAAIATARVAERADVSANQLAPAVQAFLGDSNEGVAMWGMKGARAVIKPALTPGASGGASLVQAMLNATKKFPSTTAAAYLALAIDQPPEGAVPKIIETVQTLMELRVAQWTKQVPVDPTAENVACSMLSATKTWQAHKPEQKVRTVQDWSNLSALAGQQVVGQVSAEQKESIALLVRQVAAAVAAVGVIDSKTELRESMRPLLAISTRSSAQEIAAASKQIYSALEREFPTLNPPPKITATSAAATSSSTSAP